MAGVWTIFRREMAQYFASPVAYLVAFAFLVITALLFNNDLTLAVGTRPANPAVIPEFLAFGLVVFAPLLTMRLFAEESREGTLELLLTAPVNDAGIVIGKFLSAWAFYTILLLVPLVTYTIILYSLVPPDMGQAFAAYIGIWLYGGAALAVGTAFSAMTENQIVAAFLSMTFLLLMYLGDLAGEIVASFELANLIRKLTLSGHFFSSFLVGLIRAEDIAYYAGIIVIALFITIQVVASHRWR
jgi:ABC-2 type transport system permease protein